MYSVLFGSPSVRRYIGGELWSAENYDLLYQLNSSETSKTYVDSRVAQTRKSSEVQMVNTAFELRRLVQDYGQEKTDKASFIAWCQQEGTSLSSGPMGYAYATAIGQTLTLEARTFIGLQTSLLGIDGHAAKLRKRGFAANHNFVAGQSVARALHALQDALDFTLEKQGGGESSNSDSLEEAVSRNRDDLPIMINCAVRANVNTIVDITSGACNRLFLDGADLLSAEVRLKRAEAVCLLGQEILEMAKLAETIPLNCLSTVEESNLEDEGEFLVAP